ncbi:Nbl1 / Borealin N terminal domain containing protein [Hyaloscypha variabilis]
MAPTRSKKQRKSTESAASVEAPSQILATKTRSPARTPSSRSPIKKVKMGITLGQKQALIDNLQLEITERARKLRAQYMHQAQVLRSRIEIRVHRIPMAMRKVNIGELLLKHSQGASTATTGPSRVEKPRSPAKNLIQEEQSRASPSPQRGQKRLSDDISVDKENEDIENPKKRARGPIVPTRTTSREKLQPSQVLSPRSANSRSMPRSPIRAAVPPARSQLARPVSPLKPVAPTPAGGAAGILTNMVEKAKTTRAVGTRKGTDTSTSTNTSTGAGRGKRTAPAAPAPKIGRGRAISDTSDSSTTTVVRKPVPAKKAAPEKEKKTVMTTIKGMGSQKKLPASKPAAAPTTGGRVLRKRN